MPDLLLRQRTGPVLTLTLNRPDKRNALDGGLVQSLTSVLQEVASDESVRVVVVTGAGSSFSAGADLEALQGLQSASAEENLADSERLATLFETIYHLPQPVIARVNGHAIAGGCGLASVCDFALVAEHAKLGFTEVRIGFVPAIVSVFALRKLREASVRDLMLRGHLITAEEAVHVGLVTRSMPAKELDAAVDALAHEMATSTSSTAVAMTKRLLADLPGMGLREALDHAAAVNALARGTSDCRAGVQAFLKKEDPPWKAPSGASDVGA
jgi:methylglutaconyl-CoA hydratase